MAKKKKKSEKKGRSTSSAPLSGAPARAHQTVHGLAEEAARETEDLSLQRHDEETVLSAIYGKDFRVEEGAWNCPTYRIRIRPAGDVTDHGGSANDASLPQPEPEHRRPNPHDPNKIEINSCEVTLNIQLNQKYPHSKPLIQITDTVNVFNHQLSDLLRLLQAKATECSEKGYVMGLELGQIVESYLVDLLEKRKEDELRRQNDIIKKKVDFAADFENSLQIEDPENKRISDECLIDQSQDIDVDTQRELARQMEALDSAARERTERRQQRKGISGRILSTIEDGNEEDEDAGDLAILDTFISTGADTNDTSNNSWSRYQTDFVELGVLGAGGGGTVVKAMNRLDRRVYAVKKILLEAANESLARNKLAQLANEKIGREVTTISQLQHKNIVRYYQAWVEQPEDEQDKSAIVDQNEASIQETLEVQRDNESDSWSGFSSDESSSSSSSDSSASFGDDPMMKLGYSRSLSLENFLEREVEATDFANPLMAGNGPLIGYHRPDVESGSEPSGPQTPGTAASGWSSSDPGGTCGLSRETLFIQMEYCQTTMRDVIDNCCLTMDECWRALRQVRLLVHCRYFVFPLAN